MRSMPVSDRSRHAAEEEVRPLEHIYDSCVDEVLDLLNDSCVASPAHEICGQ